MALTQISKAGVKADLIDGTKIADDAIDSEHYTDGSIDTAHIANDAVDGTKLANNIDIAGSLDVTNGITSDSTVNIINTSANPTLALQSANNGTCEIKFGDAADIVRGNIIYHNGTAGEKLQFNGYNNTERLNIDSNGNVNIPNDTGKLRLGTSNDLELYHGSDNYSYIKNSHANGLWVASDLVAITNGAVSENMAKFIADGAVELYHNHEKKLETTTEGIKVINQEGDSGAIQIIADDGDDNGDTWEIRSNQDVNDLTFRNDTGGSLADILTLEKDGDLKLTGDLWCTADNKKVQVGASADLQLYHDGSDSYIYSDNKQLYLCANGSDIRINPVNAESSAKFIANGAVELYHDSEKKFETNDNGVTVTGRLKMATQPYFHVRLNGNHTSYNGNSTTTIVNFNYEHQDLGGDFNTSTHLFTAPCSGIYAFIGSTYANESNSTQAWLVVNDAREQYSDWVQNGASSIMCSHHVVKLASGDTVGYHVHTSDTSCTIEENQWHTYFKGYLVYET